MGHGEVLVCRFDDFLDFVFRKVRHRDDVVGPFERPFGVHMVQLGAEALIVFLEPPGNHVVDGYDGGDAQPHERVTGVQKVHHVDVPFLDLFRD